jgi:outer membrane protein TolC
MKDPNRHHTSHIPPKLTSAEPMEVAGQKFADADEAVAAAEQMAKAGKISPADLAQVKAQAAQMAGGKPVMTERDQVNDAVRQSIAQLLQQQGQAMPGAPVG